MAEFNEEITRLYFEKLGFFVITNVKYETGKMGSKGDIDLLIYNLNLNHIEDNKLDCSACRVLDESNLRKIKYGLIEVKGWHTQTFTLGVLKKNAQKLELSKEQEEKAIKIFHLKKEDYNKIKKIIVLSKLSKNKKYRDASIKKFVEFGYDYILEFKTIVSYLSNNI